MPQPRISISVRVLSALSKAHEPLTPNQIARKLNVRANCVRVILGRLSDRGAVCCNGDHAYHLPADPDDGVTIWSITMRWRG